MVYKSANSQNREYQTDNIKDRLTVKGFYASIVFLIQNLFYCIDFCSLPIAKLQPLEMSLQKCNHRQILVKAIFLFTKKAFATDVDRTGFKANAD